MIRFYSFRINLIEPAVFQKSIFDGERKPKEEYFYKLIKSLAEGKKSSYIYRGIKYFVFFIKEILDDVYVLEMAKEETYMKPVEGAMAIEEVMDVRTPFIYVIIDLKRQIILLQDKIALFSDIDIPKLKIESFLSERLAEKKISVYLKPITDKNDFWEEVETLDHVSQFDLTLNAPNLFKGRFKASEFVKEVYENYNITEFKVVLKNKLGNLKLLKENLQDYIALASAGAGRYMIKAFRDGSQVIITSLNKIRKIIYNIDKIEELNTDKLEKDLIDLDISNDDVIKKEEEK